MNPYYFNEAVIDLGDIECFVDSTRQQLQFVTPGGAELRLEIERSALASGLSLTAAVDALVAENLRSLRQFELMSRSVCTYAEEVQGIEVTVTFVEKDRGPVFVHEFHCLLGQHRLSHRASSRLRHAALCNEWMRAALQSLRLR
ncbi:Hypothetical protein A7982_06657 [Minicystis rosea]|nr:Hypothetical protein A7982_06657 [Minicystis rosea]